MAKDLWDFIGVSGSSVGEADRLRDELTEGIFLTLESLLGMSRKTYPSLDDMIQAGIERNDRHAYFWAWLKDHGYESLRKLYAGNLPDDVETLGCLDECQYMLQTDRENQLADVYFESIAAVMTAIENVLSAYKQTSAGTCTTLTDTTGYDYWASIPLTSTKEIKSFIIDDSVAPEQRSLFVV